jgi:hypothetical protein
MPVYISKNNQQTGPFEDEQVIAQLQSGAVSPDDFGIRHGDTDWRRLGDLFAGRFLPPLAGGSFAPDSVQAAAGGVASAQAPKKGGCLKGGLIGAGILLLLLGIAIAAGSRFIPSVSCDLAKEDDARVDKLRDNIDKAKKEGRFDQIGKWSLELDDTLKGAAVSQRYCSDDKLMHNVIGGAGGVAAFIGLVMLAAGLIVGRRK